MSSEEQNLTETKSVSENLENQPTDENLTSNNDEKSNDNEKLSSSENKISSEQEPTRRIIMAQDIRYATEQGDRDKLLNKYNNYQVSDTNSCNIRFITDNRQKRNLLGRNEEENSNLHSISKSFNVNLLPAYQTPTRHSYKIFGTESNIRKCLIEVINRMFKQQNRLTNQGDNENSNEQVNTLNTEKPQETEVSTENDDKSSPQPTSVFITTINPDSSITEEIKPIIPPSPNKTETKDETNEEEHYKYIPLERKPEYTFIILITGQGQEVLKKNWSFFAGSLQQRLNVTVTNPFKLPKFGDKQWQNELSITGEIRENIIDAALQISAFINDVLGIPIQPYKYDEEHQNNENHNYQRTKNNYNQTNDYHHQQQQRRHDYNNSYRQSPNQYQGQSSPFNNHHERTFVNRSRNGIYEQMILIRSNCVARIVGTRGSNLRRIQTKCHLRDIIVARQPNENGYTECTLSAYQTRNLNFAIDTIRSFLRNEDDQAVQVFDSHFIDMPLQSSPFQNDQPQLSTSNQNVEYFQNNNNNHHPQQSNSFTTPRETGFMTKPLHYNNGNQLPQPSYNFQNTPSFDFTHQPTSASRKTDKRPGEVNDFNQHTNNGHIRTSNDQQYQQNGSGGGGSSSSNSSSVSPRHKSKRTCPETKEIDCTTDDGFWIQKQYYHALDDTSKELFDTLLDKLEKIRIANEENAARKQQRLVGRNRTNKTRPFSSTMPTTTTQTNDEKDSTIKSTENEHENKVEELINHDEPKDLPTTESESSAITTEEK